MTAILLRVAAIGVLLSISVPASAQQPLPPPSPEGDSAEPPPPSLPPAPPRVQQAVAVPDKPTERVESGLWGFIWRFGGLGTLATFGDTNPVSAELTISEVAAKYVFSEEWQVLGFVGTGLQVRNPKGGEANTDWGLSLGGGFERHFRVRNRISPLLGASLAIRVADPSGDFWSVSIALGPHVGIEYFVADRLSLTATYAFLLAFSFQDPGFGLDAATQVQSQGLLGVTAYF